MTDKQCDRLIDYFNGHLEVKEEQEFEQHLIGCSDCREELAEWQEVTESLAFQAEPVEPPSGMKHRVLSSVLSEEEVPQGVMTEATQPKRNLYKSKYVFYSVAAALFISVIGNVVLLSRDVENQEPIKQVAVDKVMQYVALSPVEGEAIGTAAFVKSGDHLNMVIQASQLQALQGDQVYQVWLIKGDKPYRAGTFVSSEKGDGAVIFPMERLEDDDWDAVAITLEPDGKSQTPKGSMVLKSAL